MLKEYLLKSNNKKLLLIFYFFFPFKNKAIKEYLKKTKKN